MTENEPAQPAEGGQQPYHEQPTPSNPPFGAAPVYGQPAQAPVSPSDARMWSLFAHLGGIFFSFVAPLVIYLIYKDRDPFVRRHSTQALNFQIILAIAYFVSLLLTFIIIGIFTWLAAGVCAIVFPIMGAVAANAGREYTYPFVPQMVT
jgi:uncharacterized Tic20 family protein